MATSDERQPLDDYRDNQQTAKPTPVREQPDTRDQKAELNAFGKFGW